MCGLPEYVYGRNPYSNYDNTSRGARPRFYSGDLDDRLPTYERVVTLDLGDEFVAYSFAFLSDVRVYEDVRQGRKIVVLWTPGTSSALSHVLVDQGKEVGATGVFAREVDGQMLTFATNPDDEATFVDEATGSVWNVFGQAVAGPLEGAQLEAYVHGADLWFAWAAFHPDTEVVSG